ncbi:hypothetical protein ACWEN4_21935 [Streptomyces violaceorubidus]
MNDPSVSPNSSPSVEAPAPQWAVEPFPDRGDSVDAMLRQWEERRPGVDVSSGEVVARLLRAARLAEELFEERLRRQPGRAITNVGDSTCCRPCAARRPETP